MENTHRSHKGEFGFFDGRVYPRIESDDFTLPLNQDAFAKCVNLSSEAYYCLHHKLATYAELDTVLTLEDAFNLIEFHRVSTHNDALLEGLKNEFASS